ncbi:MAG: hypothetical protein ACRDHY_11910 [Anaerolineales bacterium]
MKRQVSIRSVANLKQFQRRSDQEVAALLRSSTARINGRPYVCRRAEARLLDGTIREADALDLTAEGAWMREGGDVTFIPSAAILRVTLTDARPAEPDDPAGPTDRA